MPIFLLLDLYPAFHLGTRDNAYNSAFSNISQQQPSEVG